jgi:hypothetical protein
MVYMSLNLYNNANGHNGWMQFVQTSVNFIACRLCHVMIISSAVRLLVLLISNTTAAKEHVSKAECTIWTIKERTLGVIATLPFKHIPRLMKIEFIHLVVVWMNVFPVKTGILLTYSLRELLVHWRLDYKKHCQVLWGIVICTTSGFPQIQ